MLAIMATPYLIYFLKKKKENSHESRCWRFYSSGGLGLAQDQEGEEKGERNGHGGDARDGSLKRP